MSNRIKDVFAAIHRRSTGSRLVMALSRADAERIPLLPDVAMISITAPGSVPAHLPAYDYLLRLSFSDVDFMAPDLTKRAQQKLAAAMTKAQAREIHTFVKGLPCSVSTLLVHCEGGFSRSCGVASALNVVYGFEVEGARLKDANQSVKNLLIDVAETMKS